MAGAGETSMDRAEIIHCDRLAKHFGATRALDGVSWAVRRGRLVGFLGPNGAGKTTALRILMGLLRATSGRASIFGLDVWRGSARIKGRLGYLPGDVQLYRQFTGWQIVRFVARARGLSTLSEVERLADVFQIDLGVRVRSCSKGMRQKIGLIAALMHQPELLILDEPTAGLDPLMQQALYVELRSAVNRGATVLLSSHSLVEVESLCEDVVILRSGKVVAATDIEHLRSQLGQRVTIELADSHAACDGIPVGLEIRRRSGGRIEGYFRGDANRLSA